MVPWIISNAVPAFASKKLRPEKEQGLAPVGKDSGPESDT